MEDNKKEVAIDVNELTKRIYNKIAVWNNEDGSSQEKTIGLKTLSHDIVSDVISTVFSKLEGVKVKEKIIPGKSKSGGIFRRMFGKNKNGDI